MSHIESTRCLLMAAAVVASLSSARLPAEDAHTLVYMDDRGPVLLSLHIRLDGRPFQDAWRAGLANRFAEADVNDDGVLSDSERTSKVAQAFGLESRRVLDQADLNPPDESLSLAELLDCVEWMSSGPVQFENSANQTADATVDLFARLDRDKNRRLTRAEIEAAPQTLRKFDLDRDGTYSTVELLAVSNPLTAPSTDPSSATIVPLISLSPTVSAGGAIGQLLERYKRTSSLLTTAAPIGLELKQLQLANAEEFDRDRSGRLEPIELRRLLRTPVPHAKVVVSIGNQADSPPIEAKSPIAGRVTVKKGHGGIVSLLIGGALIEMTVSETSDQRLLKNVKRAFNRYDRDNNDYLDPEEMDRLPVDVRARFIKFDRDTDEKLFWSEVEDAVRASLTSAQTTTRLAAENRGKDLFQILDANRDRRISPREILRLRHHIDIWDRDEDNTLESVEIPHVHRVTFSRGRPDLPQSLLEPTGGRNRTRTESGPTWFRRMDRNRDGELSRREFLGTETDFGRLDKNGDGALDPEEAEEFEDE